MGGFGINELIRQLPQLGIIFGCTFLVMLLFALYTQKRKDRQVAIAVVRKKKTFNRRNILYTFTQFFKKTPVIKKRYNRMRVKMITLYPDAPVAVDFRTTAGLLKAYIFALVLLVIAIATAHGDWFFIVGGALLDYIILDYTTSLAAERMENKILIQLRSLVTQIIANYNKCGMVDDAIHMTLATAPDEIGRHADLIYKALTSVNIKEASDEYVEKAPNNYLMLLMAICSSVQEYGDKKLNGESMFVRNLTYLNEEISKGITQRKAKASLFKNQILFCLIPAFTIKPLQYWVESIMPSSDAYFRGMFGTLMMALQFVVIFVCYSLVSSLKTGKEITIKEKSIWQRIAAIPGIAVIFRAYNAKHFSKSMRINDDLMLTRDRTGVNAYYTKKWIFGMIAVVLVTFLMSTSMIREKNMILTNFSEEYNNAFVTSESYRQSMRETSKAVAETFKINEGGTYTKDDIKCEIETNSRITDGVYSSMMADTIYNKLQTYHNMFYRWQYLIMAYFAGIIAFFLPNWILRFKVKEADKEQIDEVAQFQTIALILMHVDGVTLETILEWMERFAFCFKYKIQECMVNLSFGEQKALEKMQDSPSAEFNQFVDCLENIDNIGVTEAFLSIEGDRAYYSNIRDQENEEAMKSRATAGSMISFIPVFCVIVFQMIMPLFMISQQMQSQLNNAISGL